MLIDDILEAHAKGTMAHQQMRKDAGKRAAQFGLLDFCRTQNAVMQVLPQAQCFQADAAAAYIQRVRDQGRVKLLDTFPALTPPYDLTWIEYQDTLDPTCERAGALVVSYDLRDFTSEVRDGWQETFLAGVRASLGQNDNEQLVEHLSRAAWVVTLHVFTDDKLLRTLVASGVSFILPLTADGLTTGAAFPAMDPFVRTIWRMSGKSFDDSIGDYTSVMGVACMTLALLHCKNVRTVEHATDLGVQRHRRWLGKPPHVTYKTLVIDPMRSASGADPSSAIGGQPRAYHLVRGHFATYSEERPLFGKFAGTFFIPAHVRGTAEAGVVVKDYALAADAALSQRVGR